MRKKPFCVDFDDLCDATADKLSILCKLKEKYEDFKVTLYVIPIRTSAKTIAEAKALGDWLQLAPHGWRHTRGECLSWTDEEAKEKIELARDMGIDAPIFRAPAWLIDYDTYLACNSLSYTIASHKMFRIPNTETPEYIYNIASKIYRGVHGHLTPVQNNQIDKMLDFGSLSFKSDAKFVWPQDVAVTGVGPLYDSQFMPKDA